MFRWTGIIIFIYLWTQISKMLIPTMQNALLQHGGIQCMYTPAHCDLIIQLKERFVYVVCKYMWLLVINNAQMLWFAAVRLSVQRGDFAECDTFCDKEWPVHPVDSCAGSDPYISLLHRRLHLLQGWLLGWSWVTRPHCR